MNTGLTVNLPPKITMREYEALKTVMANRDFFEAFIRGKGDEYLETVEHVVDETFAYDKGNGFMIEGVVKDFNLNNGTVTIETLNVRFIKEHEHQRACESILEGRVERSLGGISYYDSSIQTPVLFSGRVNDYIAYNKLVPVKKATNLVDESMAIAKNNADAIVGKFSPKPTEPTVNDEAVEEDFFQPDTKDGSASPVSSDENEAF